MVSMMSFRRSAAGRNLMQVLWNLVLIISGSCICAFAINGTLIPRGFVSGGVTGLALVFHYVMPYLPVSALYTLIYIYVGSHIMDLVVTGLSQRKSVDLIISKSRGEIITGILKELNHGVTIIKGQGGYSGEPTDIIYTVIAFRELAIMKKLINQANPHAFVVVSDTAEVMGYRIGNQPHW